MSSTVVNGTNVSRPTKKLVNDVSACVTESIAGFCRTNPAVRQVVGVAGAVVREDWQTLRKLNRVVTLTGGGSGHEPCFLGYVGEGMMTAAVQGGLFAAPSTRSILQMLRLLGHNNLGGVLIVINNYTGDRLNFGLAMERARTEGIKVECVINMDDCATHDPSRITGRRGLAGLVILMKIIGYMSETGESLEKIIRIAKDAMNNLATIGIAWQPCSLPGGQLLFDLLENKMELGLGMHGEAGIEQIPFMTAKNTIELMLNFMNETKDSIPIYLNLKPGNRVAVMLNNMGSVSDIEMNIAAIETVTQLEDKYGVIVERVFVGRFVTSQEMAGISLTIFILSEFTLFSLDAKTRAVSWVKPQLIEVTRQRILSGSSSSSNSHSPEDNSTETIHSLNEYPGPVFNPDHVALMRRMMTSVCNALIANADLLNRLDSGCGDGDCGSSFAKMSKAMLRKLNNGDFDEKDSVCHVLEMINDTIEETMCGTSGGLYCLLITSMNQSMSTEASYRPGSADWLRALKKGLDAIMKYGEAGPGDRTMIDPLNAAIMSLEENIEVLDTIKLWQTASNSADTATKLTSKMRARAGRASYVAHDKLTSVDAGAKAVSVWLQTIANVLADNEKLLRHTE